MEFARVHGRALPDSSCAGGGVRIVIMLETRGAVKTVRDECVQVLRPDNQSEDLSWEADQYTQETIGAELAVEGWEAISLAAGDEHRGSTDRATVTYIVRRI